MKRLQDEYAELRRQHWDNAYQLDYSLPRELAQLEWMRAVTTTQPHDAVKAGIRTLSGLDERIRIDPISVLKEVPEADPRGDIAASVANGWEIALKWQMDLAARRHINFRESVPKSAIKYDEIVGQVIHLPSQIKLIENMGGNPNRQKAALAMGEWVVRLRNPRDVYTKYGDYMPEAVIYAKVMRPQDIVDFWGGNAKEIQTLIDKKKADDWWVIFDYVDYESRAVWAHPGQKHVVEILHEDWTLDFLPWVTAVGGTDLADHPHNRRFPLLYGIIKGGLWDNANIIGSLAISEAISEAARPVEEVSGPNPDSVETEYTQPGGRRIVPPGMEVKDVEQRPLDPALREALDRFVADMGRATVPSVLVTAEVGPNEPFAGFNLRIQQAIASLLPYKRLSERWFAEAYRQMLYWSKASNAKIEGYGPDGKLYEVLPKNIERERLYLTVELEPDVPLDRQQKITTAIQAAERLPVHPAYVLEMLGETNPEEKIDDWVKWRIFQAELQGLEQLVAMEASNQIQQLAQQMAQGILEQQVAQQQQAQAQGQNGAGPPGGVGGQLFNPAAGGAPAAQATPEATRELQTGQSQFGDEVLGA
jgi:hypothetical protein